MSRSILLANQTSVGLEALWNTSDLGVVASNPLPVPSFVHTLMTQTSLAVICPVIPSDGSNASVQVFPGVMGIAGRYHGGRDAKYFI